MRTLLCFVALGLVIPNVARAQDTPTTSGGATITAESLRARLFAFADDSMGGRIAGTPGNLKATNYMAAEFERFGLEPAGDGGTYFQTVPVGYLRPADGPSLVVSGVELLMGTDILPLGTTMTLPVREAVYAGNVLDPAFWADRETVAGRLAILTVGSGEDRQLFRNIRSVLEDPRFEEAMGVAFAELDLVPAEAIASLSQGRAIVGDPVSTEGPTPILITPEAAAALLGGDPNDLEVGATGPEVSGAIELHHEPFEIPARNVVAVLRGSDASVNEQYIALTAHNDHIWVSPEVADHDSIRAFNQVMRPLGADSPMETPSEEQWQEIHARIENLRATRPARMDSVGNGADDDGSGSVSLLEIARALAAGGERPRRSILFVSHTAEEMGLLGSRYFTDNPTVPRDSILVDMDMDMIGRGTEEDLPDGGPAYLELVGSRRVSVEFGDILEEVNEASDEPFDFNYEYDEPGHPLRYYCRADHYSYARHNIPAVAISRGEHVDYHQLTDEPEYIDYEALARVARFVRDAAVHIANLDHRPALNQPTRDPNEPCVQ